MRAVALVVTAGQRANTHSFNHSYNHSFFFLSSLHLLSIFFFCQNKNVQINEHGTTSRFQRTCSSWKLLTHGTYGHGCSTVAVAVGRRPPPPTSISASAVCLFMAGNKVAAAGTTCANSRRFYSPLHPQYTPNYLYFNIIFIFEFKKRTNFSKRLLFAKKHAK